MAGDELRGHSLRPGILNANGDLSHAESAMRGDRSAPRGASCAAGFCASARDQTPPERNPGPRRKDRGPPASRAVPRAVQWYYRASGGTRTRTRPFTGGVLDPSSCTGVVGQGWVVGYDPAPRRSRGRMQPLHHAPPSPYSPSQSVLDLLSPILEVAARLETVDLQLAVAEQRGQSQHDVVLDALPQGDFSRSRYSARHRDVGLALRGE